MVFVKICWGITLLATCFAVLALIAMLSQAKGSPQEASAAALALCIAIIPYVFTRCAEGLVKG
jgi:hypothetical protein